MHSPPLFTIDDRSTVIDFLNNNSFGTLIQSNESEPIASHLPFQIRENEEELLLTAHLSKRNPHAQLIRNGKTALVTFLGPHGYVSSSVYDHPNVPTWNYQSVHVYGTVSLVSDTQMKEHLNQLVEKHELNRDHPLEMEKLPSELIETYLSEIIAFNIISYRVEGIFKLSQNRHSNDFKSIIADLSKTPQNDALVKAMRDSQK
jgi:transcriptional regulator